MEVRSASTSRVNDARRISEAPKPIPTLSDGPKPKTRVEGVPASAPAGSQASRVEAVLAEEGPKGIPVQPMGSRIPQAAQPAAMNRSIFDSALPERAPAARPVTAQPAPPAARPAQAAAAPPRTIGQPSQVFPAAPKSAQLSFADVREMADNLDDALGALARRPSQDPTCIQAAKDAAPVRDGLRKWLAGAASGDSFTMTAEMLGPLDRAFACGFAAKRLIEASQPNTGAYVALAAALVAGAVLLNL